MNSSLGSNVKVILTTCGLSCAIAVIVGQVYFLIVFLSAFKMKHKRLSVTYVVKKYNVQRTCRGS